MAKIDMEKVIKAAEICLRYIDDEDCPTECPYFDLCAKALALLKEQEAVVRCKDCKYNVTEMDGGEYFCKYPGHGSVGHTGSWFCADGQRK